MPPKKPFNEFQLAVFKTRLCTSRTVSLAEVRAIGRRLNLTVSQVRNWFSYHKKKLMKSPQVKPEIQKSIENLLNEVKEEMEQRQCHAVQCKSSLSINKYQNKILETRFCQSPKISSVECHIIGCHFQLKDRQIANWFSRRRRSKKETDSKFVMSPKILELLSNIKEEVEDCSESIDTSSKMSSKRDLTKFQIAVLKTRLRIKGKVFLPEAEAIGRRLNLSGKRVRNWFWNNKNKQFELLRVAPDTQASIDDLLSEVKKEMEENRFTVKERFAEKVTRRFRQSPTVSGLECHLIGRHFDLEGESIKYWFLKRERTEKEDNPNFVVCPEILELLGNISKEVDKDFRFRMGDSQEKHLEQQFVVNQNLSKDERISLSEATGVPDYFIKLWFKRRFRAERQRMNRADLASNSSDNRKNTERISEPSPASEAFDSDAQSNSDDWFENMASIPDSSEIFVPGDTVSIPSSSQVTIERNSKPASASEFPESEAESISNDWFEKMATFPETAELFLPVDLFSIPTSSQVTTSTVMSLNFQHDNVSSAAQQSTNQYPDLPFPNQWSPSPCCVMAPAPPQSDFPSSQATPYQFD